MRRALALVAVFFLSQISAQAADTQEKVVAALTDTGRFLHTLVREPPPLLLGPASPTAQVAWSVERPSSFPALSMTFQVLSGLDWYTTSRALRSGREANPILAPIAGASRGAPRSEVGDGRSDGLCGGAIVEAESCRGDRGDGRRQRRDRVGGCAQRR